MKSTHSDRDLAEMFPVGTAGTSPSQKCSLRSQGDTVSMPRHQSHLKTCQQHMQRIAHCQFDFDSFQLHTRCIQSGSVVVDTNQVRTKNSCKTMRQRFLHCTDTLLAPAQSHCSAAGTPCIPLHAVRTEWSRLQGRICQFHMGSIQRQAWKRLRYSVPQDSRTDQIGTSHWHR